MSPTNSLRVLHIGKFYPPHHGGIENHLRDLCTGLQEFAEVRVIAANDSSRTAEDLIEGVKVTRVGTSFGVSGAPVCPGMVRQLREAPADLIHLHLPNPTAILAYLASRHPGRLVVSYHSDIVRQRLLGGLFGPLLRRLLLRSAAIVVASVNYMASSPVLSSYADRCRVIPYGIGIERFERQDASAVAALRARYGARIVLAVGRLVYYKGFDYLIRAMPRVRGRLVIVGEGPLRRKLEREAAIAGVSDRVTIVSGAEDVVPYYHAADVFVLPSVARSEAFGIVQLEAMACGKPVVNTRLNSGVPSVSLDGMTGLTVAPADSEALAAAIQRLLDDEGLRNRLSQAAGRRVRDKFSLELMVRRMWQLYRQVMGSADGWSQPHCCLARPSDADGIGIHTPTPAP